ncbi:hypothetical protein ACKGJN_12905 [Gillisia sp. Q332]|uniref:hypothetical protein n=1 Tax=Gillisia xinjiangensis TaxID=3384765 RepID=UPI00391BE6F2
MKPMMILLLILCWIGNVEAQVVTQLDEARVTFSPEVRIVTDLDNVELSVKESYEGQFSENPIRFMQENFDIDELLSVIDTEDFDEIEVSFINRKGYLKATFDNDGDLVETYQNFKNILLPSNVREQLYNENKGWSMTKNKYVASGKGSIIDKQKYRIRLSNGDKNKNITIIPAVTAGGSVASN